MKNSQPSKNQSSKGGAGKRPAAGPTTPAGRPAAAPTPAASGKIRAVVLALVLVIAIGGGAFALLKEKPATTPQASGSSSALGTTGGSTAPGTTGGSAAAAGINATGDLVIPVSKVSSKATFYPATVNGVKIEVLAVKASDNSIRTAFNTCQVCFDSGRGYYKQQGDVLVCQNCGNRFKISQVEVSKGGCNPVPIFDEEIEMGADSITIPAAYLKEATDMFENWKAEA